VKIKVENKKTLLLVCDMINDLVHENGPNGEKGYGPFLKTNNTLKNAELVIANARKAKVPIAFVRIGFSLDYRECSSVSNIFQGAKKRGLFQLGTWGTEVHPMLSPNAEDFDIVKHRVSPFYGTKLEILLNTLKIERIVVFGVSTSGAVLSAVKDGHDRDFEMVVIKDACGSLDQSQHEAVLNQMNRITTITKAEDFNF
jgi:nicotinamidase-related amidase